MNPYAPPNGISQPESKRRWNLIGALGFVLSLVAAFFVYRWFTVGTEGVELLFCPLALVVCLAGLVLKPRALAVLGLIVAAVCSAFVFLVVWATANFPVPD